MRISRLNLILLALVLAGVGTWAYVRTVKGHDFFSTHLARFFPGKVAPVEQLVSTELPTTQPETFQQPTGLTVQEQVAQRGIEQVEEKQAQRANAEETISVAHEMLRDMDAQNKDVSAAEATLTRARTALAKGQYTSAWELGRQAIEEIRKAPERVQPAETAYESPDVPDEAMQENEAAPIRTEPTYYTVRRGDTLWHIAKKKEFYGRGSKWVTIWRTNESEIPDFDIIIPGQRIRIPAH